MTLAEKESGLNTHTQTTPNELTLFADLALTAPLMQAVKESGYERPTPIQARAIPLKRLFFLQ